MWVKVCGVRNQSTATALAGLPDGDRPDAVGLNFFPGSRRCIDIAMARSILDSLDGKIEPVGLFVNAPLRQVVMPGPASGWWPARRAGVRRACMDAAPKASFPALAPHSLLPYFESRDREKCAASSKGMLLVENCERVIQGKNQEGMNG